MKERIPSLGTAHTAPPIETRPITPPRYIQPESKRRGVAGCLNNRTEMKKEKIKNAIKQITRKNIQQIPGWVKANPGCTDPQSKDNDTYLQIVFNAMSGDSTEEQYNNVNKIVTKVSKGTAIDK